MDLFLAYRSEAAGLAPFTVFKLRTMSVQPFDAPAEWTQLGDKRITTVGRFLRRVRLDELPQLLNVLIGDMSLIGPRPERPELEHQLESNIPHYRKRHWMRPGLSGWAQVCAPYASSIEDSDLKLLRSLLPSALSTWLDLIILPVRLRCPQSWGESYLHIYIFSTNIYLSFFVVLTVRYFSNSVSVFIHRVTLISLDILLVLFFFRRFPAWVS